MCSDRNDLVVESRINYCDEEIHTWSLRVSTLVSEHCDINTSFLYLVLAMNIDTTRRTDVMGKIQNKPEACSGFKRKKTALSLPECAREIEDQVVM